MRCLSAQLGIALCALALGAQAQVACKLSTQYLDVFLPGGGAFIPPGTSYQLIEGNSPKISMGVYCEGTGEFPPPTIAGATYIWSTGETSQRIDVPQPSPSGPTTYTVTVSSPAGRVVLGASLRGALADAPRCSITTNAPPVVTPGTVVTFTAACAPQATAFSWDVRSFLGYLSIVGSSNQQSVTVRFNGAQPGQVMPVYLIPSAGMTQGPFASYLLTAGSPTAQLPLNPAMVAAGGTSSCSLTTAGGIKCWGDDSLGQLGDYRGASLYSTSPVNVIGGATGVSALAMGRAHGCELTTAGAVRCWGDNAFGQLGDGSVKGSSFLTDVIGLSSGVASLFAGPVGDHTCALMKSGGLKCWGRNDVGQLGTGSRLAVFAPTDVNGLGSSVASVAAGASHTCVALQNGAVKCWGANGGGQLGDGATLDHVYVTEVPGLGAGVISLVAGAAHTCALLADHTVKCWGSNRHGEIGIGSISSAVTAPTAVSGLANVTALSAGASHTCALANGALACWGRNSEGQLGDGSLSDKLVPVAASGMSTGVVSVSAGAFHTCAIISGGGTTCWGLNGSGRLGDGTLASHSAAQLVVGELGNGFLDLTAEDGFSPPADKVPVFPLVATGNLSDITARFQVRPQDVGSAGKLYVFALAPASAVKNSAEEKAAHLGHVAANSSDEPVQCVLAQLAASGQLTAVSASTLQPFLSTVFSASGQSATLLNTVTTAQSTGADFFLGYGPDPLTMLQNGTNRSVASTGSAGATTCQPQPPQTGWWWNPQEPGRGFSIEVQGNRLFYAAFHYDAGGRATWNVSPGTTSLDGSYFASDFYSVVGGQTLGGAYKAPSAAKAGSIALVFADASHGTMVWPGGTVPIERMNLVPGGLGAPLQAGVPESGWWWNPSESGRGFFIEWQSGYADLAGYMYDDAGNPVWYITVDATPDPRSLSGSWWSYANGQSMGGAFKPASQTSNNVAPVTVQFSAPDTAVMTLPNGRTTTLVRQRF